MRAGTASPATVWGRTARGLVLALFAYWGLFALVAPVNVWDSEVYNLARLLLAERGGLFHNHEWTSVRQVIFPWTFDAVHLPFLHLGFGTSLPSFFCLVGIAAAAWRLLARRYGGDIGWLGVLVLLALPTLVFQSVGSKNDVVLLFGAATWLHAGERWREDGRRVHLVFMALAIGFTAGAKTTGIFPAVFCAALTVRMLWRSPRDLLFFGSATAAALALFGSVETYVASALVFGSPVGGSDFIRSHQNPEGWRGAGATAVRYFFGNLDIDFSLGPGTGLFQEACRWCLAKLHLADPSNFGGTYGEMRFLSDSRLPGSGFGPVGMLSLVCALPILGWNARASRRGRLSLALTVFGLADLAVICLSVAWGPWNNRYLVLPMAAFALAMTAFLAETIPPARRGPVGFALLLLSLASALIMPLRSYNFRPADLVAAIAHRKREECRDRPTMLAVIRAVEQWSAQNPDGVLWLVANQDSWVLPFLEANRPRLRIVQPAEIVPLAESADKSPPLALLVLNHGDVQPPTERGRFQLLQSFAEPDTALYAVHAGPQRRKSIRRREAVTAIPSP